VSTDKVVVTDPKKEVLQEKKQNTYATHNHAQVKAASGGYYTNAQV